MGPEVPMVLSRAEIVRQLEEGARKRRRMTAARLIGAYKRGRLENPGEVLDLLALASLLKKSDQLYAPLAG